MVWAGISIDGKTDLHVIAGNLSGVRYIDEILHPIVKPYAGAVGDGFILMDDNVRPHRACAIHDCVHHESLHRNVTHLLKEQESSDAVANSHGLLPTASTLFGVSRSIWDELLVDRYVDCCCWTF
jgi:hypothetical protein